MKAVKPQAQRLLDTYVWVYSYHMIPHLYFWYNWKSNPVAVCFGSHAYFYWISGRDLFRCCCCSCNEGWQETWKCWKAHCGIPFSSAENDVNLIIYNNRNPTITCQHVSVIIGNELKYTHKDESSIAFYHSLTWHSLRWDYFFNTKIWPNLKS